MLNISKDNPTDMKEILTVIHDNWFSIDDIQYKTNNKSLEIRFLIEDKDNAEVLRNYFFARKIKIPTYECFLYVYRVEDWKINDTEKVGFYDFNDIIYDRNNKKIKITTGIPLLFEIIVSAFKISVLQTDNVVKYRTVTTVFW